MATPMNAGIKRYWRFAPNIQCTNPLRAVYLVPRYAHQIKALCFDIDADFSGTLSCVRMHQNILLAADFADGTDLIDQRNFVIRENN